MMRSPVTPLLWPALLGLGAVSLSGCDAGKEPFLNAAQAEEKGDFAAAAPLYEEVCTRKSPLCDAAKRRKERLSIKRAWKTLDEGHYKDAKAILDASVASSDPHTAEESTAMLALPELVQGLAYEDALASADKNATMKAMEGVATTPSALAPKAREWLDKNRPALLLTQVKAACVPGAATSCVESGRRLAELYPEGPEAKEAATLMADNYKRLFPKIKEVETLLIQRVSVFDKDKKFELCKETGATDSDCDQRATGPGQVPTLSYLESFWKGKLADVGDPYYKKQFEARWDKAALGEYDPEPWAKP